MKKKIIYLGFIFLLGLPTALVYSHPPSTPEDFVKVFYAEFYKGFFEALDKKKDPYSQKLVQTKKYFENNLYLLLKKDDQKRKNRNDVCGILDFDPFMSAQDDAGPVKSTQLIQKDSKTQVKVTFTNFGGNHAVVVDLKKEPEGWKITNFIYPPEKAGEKEFNLIGTLKELEKEKCK